MSYPPGSPAGVPVGPLISYYSHGTTTLLSAATTAVSMMASTPSSSAAGHASGNGTASTAAHGASHTKVPDRKSTSKVIIYQS